MQACAPGSRRQALPANTCWRREAEGGAEPGRLELSGHVQLGTGPHDGSSGGPEEALEALAGWVRRHGAPHTSARLDFVCYRGPEPDWEATVDAHAAVLAAAPGLASLEMEVPSGLWPLLPG